MLTAVALVAAVAGTAAADPAGEDVTPGARCLGRSPTTQLLLDEVDLPFATAATDEPGPAPVGLDVELAVDVAAPEAVAVGSTEIPVAVTVTVALPRSVTDPLHDLGVRSVAVDDHLAAIEISEADPGSLRGEPTGHLVELPEPERPDDADDEDEADGHEDDDEPVELATFATTVADVVDATGPDRSAMAFRLGEVDFDLRLPPLAGAFPDGLLLELTCAPTGSDPVALTHILDPGPPAAPDARTEVDFGGSATVELLVGGNPTVDDVVVTAQGVRGSASVARVDGRWELTYDHDPRGGSGPDRVEYQAVNALGASDPATVSVEVLPDPCEPEGACPEDDPLGLERAGANEGMVVLDEVEVHDAGSDDVVFAMEQQSVGVALTAVELGRTPEAATGLLGSVTVVDGRTDGPGWDLVGSVTAFTTDDDVPPCTAADPASWDRRCIPANNLGWTPGVVVLHTADDDTAGLVQAGSPSSPAAIAVGFPGSGLEVDQLLCAMEPGGDAAIVRCGAGLALLVPGSTAAGSYRAALTLTLA